MIPLTFIATGEDGILTYIGARWPAVPREGDRVFLQDGIGSCVRREYAVDRVEWVQVVSVRSQGRAVVGMAEDGCEVTVWVREVARG